MEDFITALGFFAVFLFLGFARKISWTIGEKTGIPAGLALFVLTIGSLALFIFAMKTYLGN